MNGPYLSSPYGMYTELSMYFYNFLILIRLQNFKLSVKRKLRLIFLRKTPKQRSSNLDVYIMIKIWLNKKDFNRFFFLSVDTVFLRQTSRGQGYVSKFVLTKLLNNVQKDLAFSQPVSNKMLKLLLRLLKQNSELRERIWIVDRDLEQKQILWWSAAKIARERNLDLKTMLKS